MKCKPVCKGHSLTDVSHLPCCVRKCIDLMKSSCEHKDVSLSLGLEYLIKNKTCCITHQNFLKFIFRKLFYTLIVGDERKKMWYFKKKTKLMILCHWILPDLHWNTKKLFQPFELAF